MFGCRHLGGRRQPTDSANPGHAEPGGPSGTYRAGWLRFLLVIGLAISLLISVETGFGNPASLLRRHIDVGR